jgi:hypothetical protein
MVKKGGGFKIVWVTSFGLLKPVGKLCLDWQIGSRHEILLRYEACLEVEFV